CWAVRTGSIRRTFALFLPSAQTRHPHPGGSLRLLESFGGSFMPAPRTAAVLAAGLMLAACTGSPDGTGPGPRENTGTLLGAGSGALLGAAVAGGGTGSRLAGAGIGALVGGLIGNRIGAALDDEDRRRAYAAQMEALEHGR